MKKILFFLLFVSAVSVHAQSFDERDLVGTWPTPGLAYAPLGITNIESISLGAGLYTRNDKPVYTCGLITVTETNKNGEEQTVIERVPDYYITNNNKLHIWIDDSFVMHLIIEELTATTLKVKTYDGQNFTFTKENSSASVSTINVNRSADESTYTLSGQKVENITADGIYIQNGQKKVIKK